MATDARNNGKASNRLLTRRRASLGLLVTGIALVMAATGCDLFGGGTATAPPVQPRSSKTAETPRIAPTEVVEEYQRPEYSGRRRNPFQPEPEVLQPETTTVVGEVRPLDPLEEFALSSLALTAIISEAAVPLAMFVDSTGFGHFVKEGDRIGRNGGVIASIRENEVEVREGSEDDPNFGGNVITLKLRDLEIVADDGLSDTEREALERLMQSERGREALERTARGLTSDDAPASQEQPQRAAQADPRFGGSGGTLPPGR